MAKSIRSMVSRWHQAWKEHRRKENRRNLGLRLESLEDRLALSATPTLAELPDVTMNAGTAYYINLDATDSDVTADGLGDHSDLLGNR